MHIILPKTLAPIGTNPLFFLVGPIRGGDDWQKKCCELLEEKMCQDFDVAVPCRWGPKHPLYTHRVVGFQDGFGRQLLWERYYLAAAGRELGKGCILAWLPCESETNPRDDGQLYARDTYGELGEWRGRFMCRPNRNEQLPFAIGAEAEFPGFDVIKRNFDDGLKGRIHFATTLEMTVEHAVSTLY